MLSHWEKMFASFLPSIWFFLPSGFLSWPPWERPAWITPLLILGLIPPARFRQRQQIHSGSQSKAITHRPLGEREGDWQGREIKNEAWSRGMTVALSRDSLDKLWAGSEAPSLGASELYCSSLLGNLPWLARATRHLCQRPYCHASVVVIFFPHLCWSRMLSS